jgi:KDO2-lipid IV(A) lauroyltransferase
MNSSNNKTLKIPFFPLKGWLVVSCLRLIYWLPLAISRRMGVGLNRLIYRFSSKKRRIMRTNLSFAYPELSPDELTQLIVHTNQQSGQLIAEFALAWFGDKTSILKQINRVTNDAIIKQSMSNNAPVIVVAPHLGNWEFFVQWVQINYPMFGLYSASRLPQLDQLLFHARSKFGCQPFPADPKGVLNLLRNIKKGGMMVILPDQVPQKGSGVYAPFYGQPAYTMTLLHKLLKKSGATLLFAECIRNNDRMDFDIQIEAANFDTEEPDVEIFNTGLNRQIESMINRNPSQYVWDYKRYKNQADGKGLYKN